MKNLKSVEVAKCAIQMATSEREEEEYLIKKLRESDIYAVAVDIGGNLISSIPKIIERALVASKRTGIIKDCHVHDGAIAGATRDALMQISLKANGLNVVSSCQCNGIAHCNFFLCITAYFTGTCFRSCNFPALFNT